MLKLQMHFWLFISDVANTTERAVNRVYLYAIERAGACVDYSKDVADIAFGKDPFE